MIWESGPFGSIVPTMLFGATTFLGWMKKPRNRKFALIPSTLMLIVCPGRILFWDNTILIGGEEVCGEFLKWLGDWVLQAAMGAPLENADAKLAQEKITKITQIFFILNLIDTQPNTNWNYGRFWFCFKYICIDNILSMKIVKKNSYQKFSSLLTPKLWTHLRMKRK